MATKHDKPTRHEILGALATGATISTPAIAEPDAPTYDPLEDFAVAWLRHWRGIGNDVVRQRDGRGLAYFIAEYGFAAFPPLPNLPPHLQVRNAEQHRGASKAMEALLDSVPGGRASLRRYVCGGC